MVSSNEGEEEEYEEGFFDKLLDKFGEGLIKNPHGVAVFINEVVDGIATSWSKATERRYKKEMRISNGIPPLEWDGLQELLLEIDPECRLASVCSDRVYDQQFEEWGINGMPSRYLAISGLPESQNGLLARLKSRP